MKIGIIGAGKVGTAFAIYLNQHGYSIHGIYSRNFSSAHYAAELTSSTAFENLGDWVTEIDILFITTPDDSIQKVCFDLIHLNLLTAGQIVVHMSGACSSALLSSAKEVGCYTFSLHPLQSFADIENSVSALSSTVFTLEGDVAECKIIEQLLIDLDNEFFLLSTEHKALYHSAACIFSNYLTTLLNEGIEYLQAVGFEKDKALKAVSPLIFGTLQNAFHLGTTYSLTGPIARGDVGTLSNHIEAITNVFPEKLKWYVMMGQKTLDLAAKAKLTDIDKIKQLKKLLNEVHSE